MDINRITVSSNDNPDWNGTWTEDEVRQEMDEIEISGPWLEYLLTMVFEEELPGKVQDVIVACPEIKSIELVLPSGTVKIMKF